VPIVPGGARARSVGAGTKKLWHDHGRFGVSGSKKSRRPLL